MRRETTTEVDGEVRSLQLLYPSMYFSVETQKDQLGVPLPGTGFGVNNIFLNGVRVAAVLPNCEAQYYLTDQVDSVKVVTNDSGLVVTSHEYLPFGEDWITEGDTKNAPKYNSQELDKESGYYFYNARHYDPEIARFVTPDTVVPRENDAQSYNRFSYCSNNPIMYKDPTGHADVPLTSDGDIKAISKISDINKNITDSFAKQNANIPTNSADTKGMIIDVLSKVFDHQVKGIADGRKRFGTVQYSTDVTINAIENLMSKRMSDYEKTGNKKLLNISSQDIVNEVMNTKVPEQMLNAPGGYGAGRFQYGKTIKDSIKEKGDYADIQASEKNIRKIADSFVQGQKELKKYYESSSGYYGQGFNDNLKLYRIDGMSAIREKQFERLTEQRKEFEKKFNR